MRLLLIGTVLGAIVVVAAVLRFADLDLNPGGLFVDEAAEALSARRLLQDVTFRPIFIADGGGREALFAYLVAGGFTIFGESVLVLRSVAAAIGVAAVAAIWLAARRFGEVAGLAAAAWAAGSVWLVSVSRDGMRNTLVPLFGALSLAALLAWQERPSRRRAALAGVVAAVAALYTYQPLKLLPLLVIVWLAWLLRVDRPAFQRLRPSLPVLAIAFLLAGTPMLVAAANDPASYFGRAVGVSLVAEAATDLPAHWLATLGMFTGPGDPNPRHNVDALPLLGWPVVVIAMIGLVRLWSCRRDPAHAMVLWSLPIFLLPPLLATEGAAPHFLRALGLAAPLAITIGLGIAVAARQAERIWGRTGLRVIATVLGAGLLLLAVSGGQAYLSRPVVDRYQAFDYDLLAMAAAADGGDIVILDEYSAGVVRFIDSADPPAFAEPGTGPIQPLPGGKVLAPTRAELEAAIGAEAMSRARAGVLGPDGRPVLWMLPP